MRKIKWSEQPFDAQEYLKQMAPTEETDLSRTLIPTMFGLESVIDPYASVYHLKIYKGDTNFTVTENIVNLIRTTPGVEFFRAISRYRFVVAFGVCFDAGECKTEIETRILNDPELEKLNDILEELKLGKEIDDIDYVLYARDGKITYKTSDQDGFEHYVENLQTAYDKHGGRFYRSV
jgi:hypothetical protein